MKKLKIMCCAGLLALSLGGCSSEPGPDLSKVLDRTVVAIKYLQDYLTKQGVKKATDEHLTQLGGFMQDAMNSNPPVHSKPIGIKLLKNATYSGYSDANRNSVQDSGEAELFKVEVDFDGRRLIASSKGQSVGSGLGSGLLTGMLLGHLLGRQRGAGIRPGHYSGRSVSSRSSYARSRSRSGGRFGGK